MCMPIQTHLVGPVAGLWTSVHRFAMPVASSSLHDVAMNFSGWA
jgi:hypothetical protein